MCGLPPSITLSMAFRRCSQQQAPCATLMKSAARVPEEKEEPYAKMAQATASSKRVAQNQQVRLLTGVPFSFWLALV